MTIMTGSHRKGCLILLPLLLGGFWGIPDDSPWPQSNAHGQYIPQYYRYDPYPNYRAFTHNFPPVYTARNLEYYKGLDYGRPERFGRVDNAFYP